MDKSSAFVWRRARRQVRGLPDCPADLTEPEYANLVFYARCHVRTSSTDGLKPSEMSHRAVKNMPRLFSGKCAAGIVQTAELDGKFHGCFTINRVHKSNQA